MEGICGANCEECKLRNKCQGCKNTDGCPFGKKCFIAKYIQIGGKENYEIFKNKLIEEINSLNISGMKTVKELYPLNGSLVNLEYKLPNGKKVKFLKDDEIYLGNKIENEFDDIETNFGIIANTNFILISTFEDEKHNEIILYKQR